MKGLEVEAIVEPVDGLTLSASFGLLDSSYEDGACPANPATIPNFPAQLGSCVVSSAGPVSVGGNPFPYAAKQSASFAADWDVIDDGDNKLTLHGDLNYTGQFYFDSFKDYSRAPLPVVSSGKFGNGEGKYWIANARATYTMGRYSISVWGKNLTDKVYYPFGISLENLFGNGYRVRAQPRTYGVEATVRF